MAGLLVQIPSQIISEMWVERECWTRLSVSSGSPSGHLELLLLQRYDNL